MKNKKLKIFFAFLFSFFGSPFIFAKEKPQEINPKKQETPSPKEEASKKEVETGEGGLSYYAKSKRKAKEPHKNTKARGPMDPSNRQGEGLQNVNGSRE
jgi:hypothetical protein